MVAFADFLGPFDANLFRTDYYGKRPLHVSRAEAALPDVFNWRRFNDALEITPYWTEDSLKLFFKSRAALRENYCEVAEGRARAPAPVNPTKVKALIALGASVVANHIHKICPEVAAVGRMLEREFAARVFANVYCSFRNVQTFQTHYDLHDVFAFQAEGEKIWRIYSGRADAPIVPVPPGDEAEKWLVQSRGPLLFEAHMKAGDILYLPRGQFHEARATSEASLHVTFGVSPSTGLALFGLLEKAAAGESAFREYLPDARDGAALGKHLACLAARVGEILTSPAFAADVLNHQRSRWSAAPKYDLPKQERATWYSVAQNAQLLRRDQGAVIAFNGGEIAIGCLHPTVEWMLRQGRFTRGEMLARQPGADGAEIDLVLAQLIGAGVVAEVEMR